MIRTTAARSTLRRTAQSRIVPSSQFMITRRASSGASSPSNTERTDELSNTTNTQTAEAKMTSRKKTMAELDEELRAKMEDRAGDGGEAGVELEDGKPVAMKRSVKNNMFRLI